MLKAARWGYGNVISSLLLVGNACVNHIDAKGFTALLEAVKFGYTEVVQLLMEHGADAFMKDMVSKLHGGDNFYYSYSHHYFPFHFIYRMGSMPSCMSWTIRIKNAFKSCPLNCKET